MKTLSLKLAKEPQANFCTFAKQLNNFLKKPILNPPDDRR